MAHWKAVNCKSKAIIMTVESAFPDSPLPSSAGPGYSEHLSLEMWRPRESGQESGRGYSLQKAFTFFKLKTIVNKEQGVGYSS